MNELAGVLSSEEYFAWQNFCLPMLDLPSKRSLSLPLIACQRAGKRYISGSILQIFRPPFSQKLYSAVVPSDLTLSTYSSPGVFKGGDDKYPFRPNELCAAQRVHPMVVICGLIH